MLLAKRLYLLISYPEDFVYTHKILNVAGIQLIHTDITLQVLQRFDK